MFGDTPLVMIEDDASLAELCARLAAEEVIGVDTESDSFHHYQEKVCLIQISDLERDYIVDPLQIDDMAPLKALLENPGPVKVLHGADYDIVCLKRDYDIALTNVFDTMIASQFLAMSKIGLADLIGHFFGVRLEKKYQRHDWSERPLLEEHLQYARGDTHWLIALREVLLHKLGQRDWIEAVAEECAVLEGREWSGRTAHPSDFLKVKQAGTLDDTGKRVLRALWEYREEQARLVDRPAFKVIPGDTLIDLARRRPTSVDGVGELLRPRSPLFRKHGAALATAVQAGLEDTRPIPSPPPAAASPRGRPARHANNDQLLGALKSWRNDIVEREGVAPVVVANNNLLREIATTAPADLDALARVDGIRSWQVETYGEQLVDVVRRELGKVEDRPAGRRRRRRRRRGAEGAPAQGE